MTRDLLPSPSDLGAPSRYTSWRPQQERAFEAMVNSDKRFIAGAMPTGFGKSLCNAVFALASGGRAIYLTSTKGLQNQLQEFRESGLVDIRGMANYECLGMDESERSLWSMSNRFNRPWPGCDEGPCHEGKKCELKEEGCLYYDANKIARLGEFVSSNYSYWLSINRWGEGLGEFDTMILDECLPPSALIGGKRIIDLKTGDLVPSWNPNTLQLEHHRVTGRTWSRATSLRRLKFDGRELICTATHRVLTTSGWKQAGELLVGDFVLCSRHETNVLSGRDQECLSHLSDSGSDRREESVLHLPSDEASLLLGFVPERAKAPISPGADVGGNAQTALASHENTQSYAGSTHPGKDANDLARNGVEASSSGGQWETVSSACSFTRIDAGMAHGVPDKPGQETCGVSDQLQDGSCGAYVESWDRGGWPQSHATYPAYEGPQERPSLEVTRLDRIEVLEPGSDGTFGGLCPHGLVYNLEVEGSHAYIAQGLAVHNSHQIPEELSAFLKIEIWDWELSLIHHPWPRSSNLSPENWAHWASEGREKIDALIGEDAERGYRRSERKKLKALMLKLRAISKIDEDWVAEKQVRGWTWEPVWPAPYAEEYLFRGIKKVVFSSATMRPKTLELLGLKSEDYDFREYPSSFPVKNRPVIHLPTVRVDKRIQPGQMKLWLGRVDQIIKERTDRKGIIHTVSYERAREIVHNSRFSSMMMTHANAGEARGVIERFRASKTPCILVSPSVTTGYDFPGDLCRYQIVGKVAFPDTRSAVMKARQAADKDYGIYLALIELVQSAGRAVRSEDDWAETFVIDDHVSWVVWKYQRFVPKWFLDSLQTNAQMPQPRRVT